MSPPENRAGKPVRMRMNFNGEWRNSVIRPAPHSTLRIGRHVYAIIYFRDWAHSFVLLLFLRR